jgi:hypothetical protein
MLSARTLGSPWVASNNYSLPLPSHIQKKTYTCQVDAFLPIPMLAIKLLELRIRTQRNFDWQKM